MMNPSRARTHVMAYWPISSNAKRSLDHYSRYLALSLEMLGGKDLYFISDNTATLSSVEELCKRHGVNLHVEKVLLDDLEKRPQMGRLLECAKNFGADLRAPPADFANDKGLIHYWRDLRQAGDEAFMKVFCVWHSKVDLLYKVVRENPFSSSEFAWVDASVSRFNDKRPGWDFRQFHDLRPGVIHHYPSGMRKNGRRLALNASVLLGDGEAVERLHSRFNAGFSIALEENYPNDEETVLDSIVAGSPDLFSVISGAHAL